MARSQDDQQRLVDQRNQAITEARAAHEAENQEGFDAAIAQAQRLGALIAEEHRAAQLDRSTENLIQETGVGRDAEPDDVRVETDPRSAVVTGDQIENRTAPQSTPANRPTLPEFQLRNGQLQLRNRPVAGWPTEYREQQFPAMTDAQLLGFSVYLRSLVTSAMTGEARQRFEAERDFALQNRATISVGSDPHGGYAVAPTVIVNKILMDVDENTPLRQLSTVWPETDGEGLGVVTVQKRLDHSLEWDAEIQPLSPDKKAKLELGKRELKPQLGRRLVTISERAMAKSRIGLPFLLRELAYSYSLAYEYNGLVGKGTTGPLGIFTKSAQGISANRWFDNECTATEVTPSAWRAIFFTLKEGFRKNARCITSNEYLKRAYLWKDNEGRFMLQFQRRPGDTDRIDGVPIHVSPYAPATFESKAPVAAFGDLQHYWWCDWVSNLQIQRLNELFALQGQVGLLAKLWTDGMPVWENAFSIQALK